MLWTNIKNVLEQLIYKWLNTPLHHSSKHFKPFFNDEITSAIDESLNNKVLSSAKSFDEILIKKNGKSLINNLVLKEEKIQKMQFNLSQIVYSHRKMYAIINYLKISAHSPIPIHSAFIKLLFKTK